MNKYICEKTRAGCNSFTCYILHFPLLSYSQIIINFCYLTQWRYQLTLLIISNLIQKDLAGLWDKKKAMFLISTWSDPRHSSTPGLKTDPYLTHMDWPVGHKRRWVCTWHQSLAHSQRLNVVLVYFNSFQNRWHILCRCNASPFIASLWVQQTFSWQLLDETTFIQHL